MTLDDALQRLAVYREHLAEADKRITEQAKQLADLRRAAGDPICTHEELCERIGLRFLSEVDARRAFESWLTETGYPSSRCGEHPNATYVHEATEFAWEAWQARAYK